MSFRNIALVAAIAAAPAVAAAQSNSSPLSLSAIEQRLTADGFRIVEVERYANSIEVKGYDRTGQCVEIYLDPRTGDLLRRERDDSCGRSEGSEGRDSDDSDDHHRHHGGR